MNEQVTTQSSKFACLECSNEVTIEPGKKPGDVIECPYCGIEYEVVAENGGEYTLQMIEEEK